MMLWCLPCCVLLILVWPLSGEQCKPLSSKPCAAECNGTTFDLSNVFHFPLTLQPDFKWVPCTGAQCPMGNGTTAACAVCQYVTDTSYTACCGQLVNPVWIWEADEMKLSPKLNGFPDWQIEYTFGASYRMSLFSFIVDEKQEEPEVMYVGQEMFTYYFHVIGKCIGQQTFECQKYYDKIKYARMQEH